MTADEWHKLADERSAEIARLEETRRRYIGMVDTLEARVAELERQLIEAKEHVKVGIGWEETAEEQAREIQQLRAEMKVRTLLANAMTRADQRAVLEAWAAELESSKRTDHEEKE